MENYYYARMELVAIWLYFYGNSRRANIALWLVVATRSSIRASICLVEKLVADLFTMYALMALTYLICKAIDS